MAKRNTKKELLDTIEELRKESRRQIDLAIISVAVAYILVGISMRVYSNFTREIIGLALIAMGLIAILWMLIKDRYLRKKGK